MRPLSTTLLLLLVFLVSRFSAQEWPLHDDGLNNIVQWDHYSFELHGQRVFLFSGEWHYWRIPVPELWIDILQKIKAAGFTAFAMYVSWGYHAPNNQTLDFSTGAHNFTPIFDIAKDLGLYVLVRPGPYMNAEANAGGFPLWLSTGEYGTLRNNDSRYTEAWKPYFSTVSDIAAGYQITNGQNIISFQIENEYGEQWIGAASKRIPNETAISYMELLEEHARANGINVPLVANEPNMNTISWGKDWSNAGGNVDVVGLDDYPSCWTCDLSQCTGVNGEYIPYHVVDFYDYFQKTQQTMPSFLTEFQGGSFNPWGGPEGGCPDDIGPDFANLFYRWNIGQRVTAVNIYMLYGGTSWGAIAAPVTATSYDYSAPISEDRAIGEKYYETKLVTLFTRAAQDLTVTDLIGNGTQYTTNKAVQAYEIRNPNSSAGFYVTLHANSSSSTNEIFQLHVNTSAGPLIIPEHGSSIRLNGHQSKIIVTDFKFGSHNLLYSTAEVLTYSVLDGVPTLALWVPTGESGEFSVDGAKKGSIGRCDGSSGVKFYASNSGRGLTITFTQARGMSVIELDSGARILLMDRTAAYQLWAPTLSSNPLAPEGNTILVQGPYLVRDAKIVGSTVLLTGDSSSATRLEVFAPKHIKEISWNGKKLHTSGTAYGSLISLTPEPKSITLPLLDSWKFKNSLPEKLSGYDDSGSAWLNADHMTTANPSPPVTYPVLYGDDYGFHNGVRLWRGYFNGSATGVFLTVQGGNAFGWSAWLNGQFLGSYLGDASLEVGSLNLTFGNATVHEASQNVLLIVHDDTGHDETTGVLNPRGILQASLLSNDNATNFSHWRVAGTAGGESNLDPIRGVYNEDGLYAERMGWHLPGFNDDEWADVGTQLKFTGADIHFYRTVAPLNIPKGVDVSVSFLLSACGDTKAFRAQLFVNGYQYGRFNPWIGNQVEFPVPPGVLDYTGDNTIGLAVWAQTDSGACTTVDWKINYVVESSLDVTFDGSYLRPGWTERRLKFS
ncbi:beta-galactosidase [Penicillium lagena]|uniref:beta-galactosidase n=1 Tax=Penicillium lagena TaxID=94218 RepID=UPI00254091D7|nr:beta-galactosidase [Penicillium lagena]KAJ5626349.1 beta-galactosidase [Penicillium lagena]